MLHRMGGAGMAMVVAGGCASTDPVDPASSGPPVGDPPARVTPEAPGPYAVGVTTATVPGPDGRTLTVEVWYPGERGEQDLDTASDPETYHPVLRLPQGAGRDVPVDPRGTYPLVGFSHGFGGVRFQSAFLTEHLASHGFVVVAPDHPGTSLLSFDADGAADSAVRRPAEVSAALDAVLGSLGERLGLSEVLDRGAVGVVGHSFGAVTSLVLGGGTFDAGAYADHCADEGGRGCAFTEGLALDADTAARLAQPDPRVTVVAALAPGGAYAFGAGGERLGGVVSPLVLAGTADGDLPYDTEALPVFEALGPDAVLGTFEGDGHWAFTDLCGFAPLADCAGEEGGFLDPEVVRRATRRWVTAHLGEALAPAPIWAEGWTDDPGAVLTRP